MEEEFWLVEVKIGGIFSMVIATVPKLNASPRPHTEKYATRVMWKHKHIKETTMRIKKALHIQI